MGYRNPRAAVVVGVYYRVSENLKRSAPWPPEYFNGVSEAVCSEKVRFLGGVFECPSQQAAELGRSCGAVEDERMCQPMHDGEHRAGLEHRPLRQGDSHHRRAHAQHIRERQVETRAAILVDLCSCALCVQHKVDVVMCDFTKRDHDTRSKRTWRRGTLGRTCGAFLARVVVASCTRGNIACTARKGNRARQRQSMKAISCGSRGGQKVVRGMPFVVRDPERRLFEDVHEEAVAV